MLYPAGTDVIMAPYNGAQTATITTQKLPMATLLKGGCSVTCLELHQSQTVYSQPECIYVSSYVLSHFKVGW